MKVAVPEHQGIIDAHFGHCEGFSVFTIGTEKTVVAEESVKSPSGCGCRSDIASVLSDMGVTHLIAGGMGEGAAQALSAQGITVIRGVSGSAREAAEALAHGTLEDSGVNCGGREEGHRRD